jgi:hypothetical protein
MIIIGEMLYAKLNMVDGGSMVQRGILPCYSTVRCHTVVRGRMQLFGFGTQGRDFSQKYAWSLYQFILGAGHLGRRLGCRLGCRQGDLEAHTFKMDRKV